MKINLSAKQLKKRVAQVTAIPMELPKEPDTLRQLITVLVTDVVNQYRHRLKNRDHARLLSDEEMDAMRQIGKIGFGIAYGTGEGSVEAAIETALQGFEDGLYRVFIQEREIVNLDAPLGLREEDTVTLLRLTMLTGGFL